MSAEQRGKIAVTMLTTGMYLTDGNTGGFTMNSALSSFLQSEINNIAGSALKSLDLSIGIDNTTDASGAMHTDYSFKFAKRFLNNRLRVEIGGKVSSGSNVYAGGQSNSFFDNVSMEYRLRQCLDGVSPQPECHAECEGLLPTERIRLARGLYQHVWCRFRMAPQARQLLGYLPLLEERAATYAYAPHATKTPGHTT